MKKMIKTKFNHEIHVSYKLVRIIYMYIRFQLGFFFNLKKKLINTLGYEKTSLVLTPQTKSIVFLNLISYLKKIISTKYKP